VRLPGFLRKAGHAGIAVVGSGLPATATALELRRRGVEVVAIGPPDAARPPGGPGLVLLGTGRPYRRVVRERGRAAARLVWAAGCENHLRLKALLEEVREECGYRARGSFLLASDRFEAEDLAESEEMLQDDGFPGEFLDHYMLETRFDVSGFTGAYWAAEDAEVDASRLLGTLNEAARSAGVRFLETQARAIERAGTGLMVLTDAGLVRAAAVVVATDGTLGALVPEIRPALKAAVSLGLRSSLAAGRSLPPAGRTVDGGRLWQSGEEWIALCGVAVEDGPPGEAESRLLSLAARFRVEVATACHVREGFDSTADGLPVVGLLGEGLGVACGFGRSSASYAFAAARWVADALLSGMDPTPEPFRPVLARGGTDGV
jgi:glycine/D-amino acid oxidase-like deaminating enzyme